MLVKIMNIPSDFEPSKVQFDRAVAKCLSAERVLKVKTRKLFKRKNLGTNAV